MTADELRTAVNEILNAWRPEWAHPKPSLAMFEAAARDLRSATETEARAIGDRLVLAWQVGFWPAAFRRVHYAMAGQWGR